MSSKLRITIEIDAMEDTTAECEKYLREFLDFEGYQIYSIKIEEIQCSSGTPSGITVEQMPKQSL